MKALMMTIKQTLSAWLRILKSWIKSKYEPQSQQNFDLYEDHRWVPSEPEPPKGNDLPIFDLEHDVLVLPLDFDPTTLSTPSRITLELLEEMQKVIRVTSLTQPAIIKIR